VTLVHSTSVRLSSDSRWIHDFHPLDFRPWIFVCWTNDFRLSVLLSYVLPSCCLRLTTVVLRHVVLPSCAPIVLPPTSCALRLTSYVLMSYVLRLAILGPAFSSNIYLTSVQYLCVTGHSQQRTLFFKLYVVLGFCS